MALIIIHRTFVILNDFCRVAETITCHFVFYFFSNIQPQIYSAQERAMVNKMRNNPLSQLSILSCKFSKYHIKKWYRFEIFC